MVARHAILVGVGQYDSLPALPGISDDLQELARVLEAPDVGDFETQVILDRDERHVTAYLESFLARSGESDVLLMHYAGHGFSDETDHLYLATSDTDPSGEDFHAISLDDIAAMIGSSRARQIIVLLDACSARAPREILVTEVANRLAAHDVAVIACSSPNPALLTRSIIAALGTAETDQNGDGTIDVSELYASVAQHTQSATRPKTAMAVAGPMGFVLARTHAHRVKCFLSHATDDDVQSLRELLTQLSVDVHTSADLVGPSISSAVAQAVWSADFVCVFLSKAPLNPAAMFEAGLAAGSRRPLLAIIDSDAMESPGVELLPPPIIRYRKGADDALRSSLTAYLRQVRPISAQLSVNWEALLDQARQVGGAGRGVAEASALEQRVALRFTALGALVRTNERIGRTEIDILATLPVLGDSFNPIAIEVKRRRRDVQRDLDRCFSLLDVLSARMGLLVYGDKIEARNVVRAGRVVLVMSESTLVHSSDGMLVSLLTRARNELVHSN